MRRIFRALIALIALTSLLILTSCSNSEVTGIGFQGDITSVNQHGFALWQGAWLAATIVGAITLVLIIWPAIFHRKREGFPKQFQYNVPAEIVYTVVPFIIIAVLFSFTAKAENKITAVSPASATNVHDITVNGIQWSWQFTYKDAGPKATVTGTPAQPPTLYMPLGEKVRFTEIGRAHV